MTSAPTAEATAGAPQQIKIDITSVSSALLSRTLVISPDADVLTLTGEGFDLSVLLPREAEARTRHRNCDQVQRAERTVQHSVSPVPLGPNAHD